MSGIAKVLLGLALGLPVGAYAVGSMLATSVEPPGERAPIILEDPPAPTQGLSPGATLSPSPTQQEPGSDDGDDDGDDDGPEVVVPSYVDRDDGDDDDDGGGKSGPGGGGSGGDDDRDDRDDDDREDDDDHERDGDDD